MEKIILFGAGKNGQSIYQFLKQRGQNDVVECFCDNNIKYTEDMGEEIAVYSYETCKNMNYKFVIATAKYADEIEKQLQSDHRDYYSDIKEWAAAQGIDMVEWDRDYCAWYHIGSMEKYFAEAERDTNMNIFWDKDSVFYKMFSQLDLDNVIELAVGRGRHVSMYEAAAKRIVLVDILQENIDFCRERFKGNPKIEYYCNNGYNLRELRDGEYSALFTYDAMVHFEMMDIFEYLKDIHRVLGKGGKALFHHSNNSSNYKNSFFDAEGRRSYMSKDLFAYLAYRAGFEIVEQKVIDWGVKDLDCITLVRKV